MSCSICMFIVCLVGYIFLFSEATEARSNDTILSLGQSGSKIVLIPKENERDLSEIKAEAKEGLKIIPIQTIKEALKFVFETNKKSNKTLLKKKPR